MVLLRASPGSSVSPSCCLARAPRQPPHDLLRRRSFQARSGGCPAPSAQTLWASLLRHAPRLQRQRERLWLADGDSLDLDWYGPHQADTPLVLIARMGSPAPRSRITQRPRRALADLGWPVRELRCSGEANLLRRGYHPGSARTWPPSSGHRRPAGRWPRSTR